MKWGALFLVVSLTTGQSASASELERRAQEGYGVLLQTNVAGEFRGCNFGWVIPLANGLHFVCSGYSYHYAYDPEVLILKNVRTGQIKSLIDDEEFDGSISN
jgi:hypothetical protein